MKFLGIFLTTLMILIQSVSALDIHTDVENLHSKCASLSDCSSSASTQAPHSDNNSEEHSHCLFHCAPLMVSAVISKFVFNFIIFENAISSNYSFILNSPIIEGPFKPPQI